MLDSIGASNNPPICSKKANEVGLAMQRTHFNMGISDDLSARRGKNYYPDPQVVFKRYIPPNKNHSVVELKQDTLTNKSISEDLKKDLAKKHFTPEYTGMYKDRSKESRRREAFKEPPCQVHYGDDPRELETQYQGAHSLRGPLPVGPATQSKWPRMPTTHVIRGEEDHRPDKRFNTDQNRKSNNYSYIEKNIRNTVRNPIQGVYNEKPDIKGYNGDKLTPHQQVAEYNKIVPPLRSVGALRTWNSMDKLEMFRADGY